MMTAEATFTLDSWDQAAYDEAVHDELGGAILARARVTKTWVGDIEGTSTAELLLATAGEGSAAYVGLERIVGSVLGRRGSFVLHHTATATAQSATWSVVPDSGTGDLAGLRGTAQIAIDADGGHSFTLDFELG